jgi:hypothetical protein
MRSEGASAQAVQGFLRLLRTLPEELARQAPVLGDIALLGAGTLGRGPSNPGIIQKRLDRRYARICVVYRELGKLDFNRAAPGLGIEEVIFAQTDFSVYRSISREDFEVFFDQGLEDFEDSFYKYNLMMDREAVRRAISRCYKHEGGRYVYDGENLLLLGIMRSLHTALDFAPLIDPGETLKETGLLIRFLQSQSVLEEDALSALSENAEPLYYALLGSLDGARPVHPDGKTASLFIREGSDPPVLCGTFYPENKPHTIPLTRSV